MSTARSSSASRSWPPRSTSWASSPATAWPRSPGTSTSTSRSTWPCPAWARCCTPSTSACSRAARLHRQPRRGQGHHRRRLARPVLEEIAAAPSNRRARHRHRRRRRRARSPTACATRSCWRRAARLRLARPRRARGRRLCYTSGTTGNPKGVLYSHRSTVLHALATMADSIGVRPTTASCPSCRCSTPTPGASPTPAALTGRRPGPARPQPAGRTRSR